MSSKPRHWPINVALVLGAGLALAGLFVELPRLRPRVPADAIALVDGTAIPRADYERAIEALEADLRRPLDERDRQHVIDRLIDDVLLVEHALDLGLVRSDPYLRTTVSRAVIDRVQAELALAEPPTDAQLQAHYLAHPERFATIDRIWLEGLWFRDLATAGQVAARWASGEARDTLASLATPPAIELPSAPLPPAKLRDYLGPTASEQALALEIGEVSQPIPIDGGAWVLRCRDRVAGRVPAFAEVRERVEADLRRELEDRGLQELIAQLRADAAITLAEVP